MPACETFHHQTLRRLRGLQHRLLGGEKPRRRRERRVGGDGRVDQGTREEPFPSRSVVFRKIHQPNGVSDCVGSFCFRPRYISNLVNHAKSVVPAELSTSLWRVFHRRLPVGMLTGERQPSRRWRWFVGQVFAVVDRLSGRTHGSVSRRGNITCGIFPSTFTRPFPISVSLFDLCWDASQAVLIAIPSLNSRPLKMKS